MRLDSGLSSSFGEDGRGQLEPYNVAFPLFVLSYLGTPPTGPAAPNQCQSLLLTHGQAPKVWGTSGLTLLRQFLKSESGSIWFSIIYLQLCDL